MITYYTDFHYVDEDLMTITLHGGFWRDRDWAGIADRDAVNRPSDLSYSVASSTVEIFKLYGFSQCRRRFKDYC